MIWRFDRACYGILYMHDLMKNACSILGATKSDSISVWQYASMAVWQLWNSGVCVVLIRRSLYQCAGVCILQYMIPVPDA